MFRRLIPFLILCLGSLRAAEVSAQLSADRVEAGQGVRLSVKIEGGSPQGRPAFPEVKGLIINQRGQSQHMQVMNGKVSRTITFNYVVGAMEPGEYEVPAATVRVDGEEFRTQPIKLRVTPGANGAPPGMDEGEDAGESEAESGEHGFLSFQLATKEREHVYPGEIAPVRIRAYFPMDAQISLSGPPRPEGSAFTLHNLTEEPQQSTEVVNGSRYRVVTWFGGLSATKAGEYPASFELEARVGVRDRTARRRGSIFDDFFAPMIQKDVVLATDSPPELEVKELPQEGRPDDFTGAIGRFDFESLNVPKELEVGEPCRVEAVLKGEGNFSLLKEPHPLPSEHWKVYDGNSDFSPGDVASFAGTKRFQFNAVPLVPEDDSLSFGFSYFDPDRGEYQSVVSEAQEVTITGEASVPPEVAEAKDSMNDESAEPQLAPLRSELGRVQSYVPLSERPWFLPVIGGSVALFLAIQGLAWWRGRGVDHAKLASQANEAAAREALEKAERAAAENDGVAFFMAARDAIRLRVAERTGVRPEAVTLVDLRELEDSELSEILGEADRIDYSGRSTSTEQLSVWQEKLARSLENLTRERRKVA